MKCRKSRLIETTLKLFIEQIHIIWKQKTNRMIILLNMNVANVFNTMSHVRLIHDMKKRKISRWIIDWINNFLFDRFTTFAVNRRMIESFSMQIEISQKSSFSSILYLFCNFTFYDHVTSVQRKYFDSELIVWDVDFWKSSCRNNKYTNLNRTFWNVRSKHF